MSNALLKENDADDPMSYALDTLDPETFLRQFGFSKTPAGYWRKVANGYDHHVTLEDGKIYYSIFNEGSAHPFSAGRVNNVAELRRRVQLESLDDEVDVESYVKNSADPEAAIKELGFEFVGVNTAQPEDPCKVWRKRLKSGIWAIVVTHDNNPNTVSYFKRRVEGRGVFSGSTELERKVDVPFRDVRRTLMKWQNEDAREVVARLLDSTADNPDAFEPNAVPELMAPHRCPACRSHNVSGDIAEGMADCYNCGTAFSADRIQEDATDPDDAADFINRLPLVQPRITVSFSRTTPESSAQGDASEHGWIDEEGVDMTPDSFDYDEGISAVDKAIKFLKDQGAVHPSASHFHPDVWYSTEYQTIDYRTGEDEERSFHLKDFSPAEQQQIWDAMKRR